MYFTFLVEGSDFDSLISLGLSSMPMLHYSISDFNGSILGFLGTSFESNKSSSAVKPFGKRVSLRLIISLSSLIVSSISTCSRLSIFDLVNYVGLKLYTSLSSSSLIVT